MGLKAASRGRRVGDTFAVALGAGRFGAIRLVWQNVRWQHASFVLLDWFGDTAPAAADVRDAGVLEPQHPHYEGGLWVRMLRANRSADRLSPIGNHEPRPAELAFPLGDDWRDPLQRYRTTRWRAIDHTLRREDRWRRDPDYRDQVKSGPFPGHVYAYQRADGGFTVCRVRVVGRVEEDRFAFDKHVVRHPWGASW